MSKRIIMSVNLDNVDRLFYECRNCGYWESNEKKELGVDLAESLAKEHWYNLTISEWGSCGKIIIEEKKVVGYSQYAPPSYFPQLKFNKLGPIHKDAVFIACLYIPKNRRGRGLGKLLLNAVEKDMLRRKYRVLETIAKRTYERNPSGWVEFYLNRGFKIIKEQGSTALMRLDLNTSITWQENFEEVIRNIPQLVPGKPKIKLPSPT